MKKITSIISKDKTQTTDYGDEVILPTPYWVTYPEAIKLTGATPKVVNTSSDELIVRKMPERAPQLVSTVDVSDLER